MTADANTYERLQAENAQLRQELAEAKEALDAIRWGEVDAIVVEHTDGPRVYTLTGANEPYRVFVEEMQEGALTLRADGVIVYANQRIGEMLGVGSDDLLASPFERFLAPESIATFQTLLRQEEGPYRAEATLLAADGTRFPVYLTLGRLEGGDSSQKSLLVTDLTQQKRYQEIVSAEAFASAVLDQAVDAVVVCDEQGRVIRVNRTAQELCGGSPLFQDFHTVFPLRRADESAEPAGGMPSLVPSSFAQEPIRGLETFLDCPDRPRVDLLLSAGPLFGEDRRLLGCVITMSDVTERRRAAEELRESEFFFHQMLESIPGMIFTTRPDGYCDYQSRQWADYTGVPSAEHVGDGWNKLLHPDDQARVLAAWRAAVENKANYNLEYRVRRRDGAYEWFKVIGRPIRDEAGKIVRWFGVAVNIEELKQREAQLHASESELAATRERLELALGAGGVATWVWDVRADRVFADKGVSRFFSISPEEAQGGPHSAYLRSIHPDDRQRVAGQLQAVAEGRKEVYETEYRVTGPDGVTRWCLARGILERDSDGAVVRVPGVVLDVTDRKLAEQALERTLGQLRALFSHMTEGLVLFDPDGNLLDMNPAALAIHGFQNVENARRHIDELADTFELFDLGGNRLSTDQWPVGRVLRGETFNSLDLQVRQINTGRTWFGSYGGTPVYDSQGRLILAILTLRDVTDRYHAEEALKSARAAAEAANLAKSRFLANMSHELRTPMNTILGMTDLALAEDLSPVARDCLSTARESADTLMELLNEILDLSRIEAGGLELEETYFDLRKVVDQVVDMFGIRAYEKGIELLSDLGNVPCRLVGDPLRLRQVLANLLGNAVKFTREGEVLVTAAVQSREEREVVLEFAVTDTGIGIVSEDLERILQPFTQADASTTREYGGTGLGLTISRRLVELMGGRIEIESEPGQGSTFRFTARMSLQEKPEEETSAVRDALGGLPVLVVAENPTAARVLCETLARWGMKPRAAQDVPAALATVHDAVFAKRKFRLVLADAHLPGLGGVTLANWLAADPKLAAPFILMLHRAEARELGDAIHEPEFDLLKKPVTQSALFNAVVEALGLAPRQTETSTTEESGPDETPVRTLRILLAEDTPANQKLVRYVLKRRGHRVAVAVNGRKAVEAVQREPFDAVLMDIQMPEMDGIEATREIRRLPDPEKSRIPIIAMTAHAFEEDAERCLAAGMDEYISKPVKGDQLIALLERLAARTTPPAAAASQAAEIRPAEKPDGPIYILKEALRYCGEYEMFQDMAGYVIRDGRPLLNQMQAALAAGNADEMANAAHRLKGITGHVGAVRTTHAALAVERIGKTGSLADAAEAIRRLDEELSKLEIAIARHVRPDRQ